MIKLKTLFIGLLFLGFSLSAKAQTEARPKVMVLGTYHMANPGLDAANIQSDDVKTEQRQQEIDAIAKALLAFKPTKVAIEGLYGGSHYTTKYAAYHTHGVNDSLTRNESQQIGFRVAHMAGHESIYPIDHKMAFMAPSMDSLFMMHPEKAAYMDSTIKAIQGKLNEWTENILMQGTIGNFLHFMNTEEMIAANHNIYMSFLRELQAGDNRAGADVQANWYKRNIIIFQNLTRITDFNDPEERILVIFGQGHSHYLKSLTEEAPYYELIDVLDYLPKE